MKAQVGDRVTVRGQHVGEKVRDGEVLEVHGEDGSPPFLMRWEDGHEALFYPGPDAVVHHSES